MKPTKMRNQMIFQATFQTRSKQLGSALSKDLHKKYGKRSVRVIEGDSVTILRGEFKGVDGVISVSNPINSWDVMLAAVIISSLFSHLTQLTFLQYRDVMVLACHFLFVMYL